MDPLKTVLNVRCGPQGRPHAFVGFEQVWTELLLEIDPAVATGSVDVVVSSHHINPSHRA